MIRITPTEATTATSVPSLVVEQNKIIDANQAATRVLNRSESDLRGLDVTRLLPEWPFAQLPHSINTSIAITEENIHPVRVSLVTDPRSGASTLSLHSKEPSDEKWEHTELRLLTDGLGNSLHSLFDACHIGGVESGIVDKVRESYRQLRTLMADNRGVAGCKSPEPLSHSLRIESQAPVLLVDDQLTARKLLRRMLAPYKFEIEEAENGQIALDKIKEKAYSVIFLDIQMPVMDGRTACKLIRDLEKGACLPIIAASAETIQQEELGPEGFSSKITKPFNLEGIVKILKPLFPSKFND